MHLDVVIVNWNAGTQLAACLASLATAREASAMGSLVIDRVVVVDNASTDGSADELDARGLPLVVIRNVRNAGFGAACNQGAAHSDADALLFLNPDAEVYPDTLSGSVAYLDAHPEAGVVGVALRDEHGHVARSSTRALSPGHVVVAALGLDKMAPGRFQSHFMTEWDHADTRAVDHVIGAFYLVRRALFEPLGGFDERFFVYLEDLDLSARVRAAGFSVHYIATVEAYHKGGGTSEQAKAARLFYSLRSRILYGFKHFSRPTAQALALFTLVAEPLARLAHLGARREWTGITETLRGYRRLWAQGRDLLAGRVRTDG